MDKRVDHLTTLIKELVKRGSGRITYGFIDRELDITTPAEKTLRRVVFKDLCDAGEIRREEHLTGVYWIIDREAPEIDWQGADPKNVINLKFPLGLERYVKIFPKSIIIIAGEKEACKTLWLYTFTLLNMYHPLGIDLYNSETGKEQMRERLDNFNFVIPEPAPFRVKERYDNFADVINPNKISVIDYLDLSSEVYEVGEEIDKIFRKLKGGIAVIGLQVPPPTKQLYRGQEKWVHRDLAYGGGFTAKRAILYLTLWSTGRKTKLLKIKYCKTRADPQVDPNNMQWTFSVNNNGTAFVNPQRSGELDFGEDEANA
uniref:Uncharacterized protein n=1 Tax=viral metagenome TaxID=1070528 RepID=A0A6M3XUH2_9ZZZZ